MSRATVVCLYCERTHAITREGLVFEHRTPASNGQRCRGSSRPTEHFPLSVDHAPIGCEPTPDLPRDGRITRRGRPTSSPDGPKRPYAVKLPADVIAIIRAQPNQAEFLERLVREWTRGQALIAAYEKEVARKNPLHR